MCLRSCCVPPSTSSVLVIPPAPNSTCIGGLYSAFDEDFPMALEMYLSHDEFTEAITMLNDALQMRWPCCLCTSYGILCCPFTLGLSYFFPALCIREAESELREKIGWINRECIRERSRVRWSLGKNLFASWVRVILVTHITWSD
jgi:hypothetical protein